MDVLQERFTEDEEKIRNDMHEFVEKHFQSKDGFNAKEFATKVSQVMKKKDVVDQKMRKIFGCIRIIVNK